MIAGFPDGLLPPGTHAAIRRIRAAYVDLLPEEERKAIANAIPRRAAEFATGRQLARELLAGAGIACRVIEVGESRMPIWPADVVGSISHAGGICAVAVSASGLTALGLDTDSAEELPRDLWCLVGSVEEIAAVQDQMGLDTASQAAKVLFSIKEAVFKCWFPVGRQLLEFSDVVVTRAMGGAPAFHAKVRGAPYLDSASGGVRVAVHNATVFSAAWRY